MYDIITLGSASVDVLVKTKGEILKHGNHTDIAYHLGDKFLIDDLIFSTGGGGTNTAVAFSRLGLKTGFIGCIGHDANGELIAKELRKENVEFLGKVKQGKTGYSIVLPGHSDRTILTFKGVNNNLEWSDLHLPLETKWLYISTMLDQSLKTAEKLAFHANQNKIKIALNLSRYLANHGLKKLSKLLNSADILILNKEEAAILTDRVKIKQMLELLASHTQAIIVITDSSKPVYALKGKMIYIKKINSVKPVDKTGAGDAFAAGFVYGIMKNKDIPTSLNYGYKEALSTLKEIGAKNNLLRELK